ncbi:4a-hydroxytetrahydrobiopterin dehydratase [Candidatus Nitrotoga sp. 1052]|uniref:4a-hydroxytetrahydrobiopterin dehydratase n=1 Tax=Candidatus Nitrotoga sp. 1052 TaxID=2886964 RepID=UPI001EF52EA6|nr:4a-hydroxytetrahydrobiopterin dehydratase [Candidatus Nitrotoga sp. 1052]CAH1083871.1 putative pterin-4-alpha-carbinolamine dehydratase [Candidatus Nitrotoga sp. 1052]
MTTSCDLANKKCKPCEGGIQPLPQDKINILIKQLDGWAQRDHTIGKVFDFKNYYQTMAFVNAVAWLSHREDHHPDLNVSYNKCHVEYSTHAINGLSENDFICAAKVDALFKV